MERTLRKVFVLVFCVVIGLIAGCEEQEMAGTKKSRLIAAENMDLKKELGQRDKQIEDMKKQHDKEIKRQEEILVDCRKKIKVWNDKAQKSVEEKLDAFIGSVMEQTAQVQKENEALKSQVEELKAKLKEQGETAEKE